MGAHSKFLIGEAWDVPDLLFGPGKLSHLAAAHRRFSFVLSRLRTSPVLPKGRFVGRR